MLLVNRGGERLARSIHQRIHGELPVFLEKQENSVDCETKHVINAFDFHQYLTVLRHKPWGGAVAPARFLSFDARICAT